jgi:hypothetical protein
LRRKTEAEASVVVIHHVGQGGETAVVVEAAPLVDLRDQCHKIGISTARRDSRTVGAQRLSF